MQSTTKRRLAWLGAIVVISQLLSACCVWPVGHGGHGGHHQRGR